MARKYVYLTSGSSWTVPADWNNADNTIECIGGGGSGYYVNPSQNSGGGGGAYSKKNNLSLTIGASVSYQVGGIATDTWFKSVSDVLAKGGATGTGSFSPGAGGQASSCVGDVKYSGGDGAAASSGGSPSAGGGGGAAGRNGVGRNAPTPPGNYDGGAGGNGDLNLGGTGGAQSSGVGNVGGDGTEWSSSPAYGSGGGGSGGRYGNNGGNGGKYGGGGGGGATTPGTGASGIIVISYEPPSLFVPKILIM